MAIAPGVRAAFEDLLQQPNPTDAGPMTAFLDALSPLKALDTLHKNSGPISRSDALRVAANTYIEEQRPNATVWQREAMDVLKLRLNTRRVAATKENAPH